MTMYDPDAISPSAVAKALAGCHRVVLIGGHALAAYRHARLTKDVDIISDAQAVVAPLLAAHFGLTITDYGNAKRLVDGKGQERIDVLTTTSYALWRTAFANAVPVTLDGQQLWVPTIEMLLVMKHLASRNPRRPKLRAKQDALDFEILSSRNHADVDAGKLHAIAHDAAEPDQAIDYALRVVRDFKDAAAIRDPDDLGIF